MYTCNVLYTIYGWVGYIWCDWFSTLQKRKTRNFFLLFENIFLCCDASFCEVIISNCIMFNLFFEGSLFGIENKTKEKYFWAKLFGTAICVNWNKNSSLTLIKKFLVSDFDWFFNQIMRQSKISQDSICKCVKVQSFTIKGYNYN